MESYLLLGVDALEFIFLISLVIFLVCGLRESFGDGENIFVSPEPMSLEVLFVHSGDRRTNQSTSSGSSKAAISGHHRNATECNEIDLLQDEARNRGDTIGDMRDMSEVKVGREGDKISFAYSRSAEQESDHSQYTMQQLNDEFEQTKRKPQSRQELYRIIPITCRGQVKGDRRKEELNKAVECVGRSKVVLDGTSRHSSSSSRTDTETIQASSTINKLIHTELQDSESITSQPSRFSWMERNELNIMQHSTQFKENDEIALTSQTERLKNSSVPISTEEVVDCKQFVLKVLFPKCVNTDICELHLSIRRSYTEILSKIEKLTSYIESPKEEWNQNAISKSVLWKEVSSLMMNYVHLEKDLFDAKNLEQSLRMDNAGVSLKMISKLSLSDKNLSPMHELLSVDAESIDGTQADNGKLVDGMSLKSLKKQLNLLQEKNQELRKTLKIVDTQCEKLLEINKRLEKSRNVTAEQRKKVRDQLNHVNRQLASKVALETQIRSTMSESDRLHTKVEYLMKELNAAHAECIEETQLIIEKPSLSSNYEDLSNMKRLMTEKKKVHFALKSWQKELEMRKAKIQQHSKNLLILRESYTSAVEDNTKLRNDLAKAIEEAKQYKDETNILHALNTDLAEDLANFKENEQVLNSELDDLKRADSERSRLIAYFQSRTAKEDVCQTQNTSSKSILISGSSSISILDSANASGSNSSLLPANLRNYAPQATHSNPDCGSVSFDDFQNDADPTTPLNFSQFGVKNYSPDERSTSHDKPHRWENLFYIGQTKCTVCFQHMLRFRHSLTCIACGITAHRRCATMLDNTCGLPVQCADYCSRADQAIGSNMFDWLKIWRSDSLRQNRWLTVLAQIDGGKLCFYKNSDHSASLKKGDIVLSLDLNQENWRVHLLPVSESIFNGGLSRKNLSLILQLRLYKFSLFILAPSIQVKQRWFQALQSAQEKQIISQYLLVPSHNESIMLFALDAPLNLTIHCAKVIDQWILIGAQEGLFVANLLHREVSHVVAGLSSVYQIELMEELDMMAAISGRQRQLVLISMSDIRAVFNSKCIAAVHATPLLHLTSCHLMTAYSDSRNQFQYLLVADAVKIEILQFNTRFNILHSVKTDEPVSCLLSIHGGLIFGANQFYFMDVENFNIRPFLFPETQEDWPLAAISIGDNEFLLAFQNFGIFADINGKRTRAGVIEWKRLPMEFAYAAPYLYVFHLEALEILRVAPNEGSSSRLFMDVKEGFRCKNAHFIGRGRNLSEVIFVLSNAERTEIHSLSRIPENISVSSRKLK